MIRVMANPELKVGDRVRFRDDATSQGEPIGDLFKKLSWIVVALDGEGKIEIAGRYLASDLKMHTFAHKLQLDERKEEKPS